MRNTHTNTELKQGKPREGRGRSWTDETASSQQKSRGKNSFQKSSEKAKPGRNSE